VADDGANVRSQRLEAYRHSIELSALAIEIIAELPPRRTPTGSA
jgi:hypothetical protein